MTLLIIFKKYCFCLTYIFNYKCKNKNVQMGMQTFFGLFSYSNPTSFLLSVEHLMFYHPCLRSFASKLYVIFQMRLEFPILSYEEKRKK